MLPKYFPVCILSETKDAINPSRRTAQGHWLSKTMEDNRHLACRKGINYVFTNKTITLTQINIVTYIAEIRAVQADSSRRELEAMRMKYTTCLALGLCMLIASCSRQPVGAVRNGIVGSWKQIRKLEEKKPASLTEHVLDIVDDMTIPAPYPDRLVFRADGTYEATYSGKQLDGIRRRRGSPDLPGTLTGRTRSRSIGLG